MDPRVARVSFLKGVALVLGSLCFTFVAAFISYQYYQQWLEERKLDPKYRVTGVVQTGYVKEPLPTLALIELLGLSVDKPLNLYAASESRLERQLMKTPFFNRVKVSKVYPNILYIDYEAKKPFAYLKDYSNILIAEDGSLLPFKPFYPPKNFPVISLGPAMIGISGQQPLIGYVIPQKALELIRTFSKSAVLYFEERGFRVSFIDFQNAEAGSSELSEIVILTEGRRKLKSGKDIDLQVLIRYALDSYSDTFPAFDQIIPKELQRIDRAIGKTEGTGSWHLLIDLRTKGIALVSP